MKRRDAWRPGNKNIQSMYEKIIQACLTYHLHMYTRIEAGNA